MRDVVIPEFSTRLRHELKIRKITQVKLAELIGAERHCVHDWCVDRYLPSSQALYLICKTLNVSADYLLELSDKPRQED